MAKPLDDRPRSPAGMPLFSMKKWERMKAAGKVPYSTFRNKPQGKSKEQLAYEAENLVRARREKRGECEVLKVLEEIGGLAWLDFKRRNGACERLWTQYETHHVYGRKHGHQRWNLIRALEACHRFAHENPPLARLACMLAKDKKGELELEKAVVRLGKNPIGLVANDLEDGKFSGMAAGEAQRLCDRYGV